MEATKLPTYRFVFIVGIAVSYRRVVLALGCMWSGSPAAVAARRNRRQLRVRFVKWVGPNGRREC
jgi:hypothetical protein